MTALISIGRAGPRTVISFCLDGEPDGSHIWQYLLDVRSPTAKARRLTDRKEPEYNGVFSPDGKRVLFSAITLSGTQGTWISPWSTSTARS